MVVYVHFESELTLWFLRERLRLITPHWSPYPNAVSIIMGDLNICVPEKGSMCGIKPSPTVTRERLPCFIPFFHMPSRVLNLTTLGRTHLSLGRIGLRAWRVKKPMLCLHVVSDADGHLLENENESWRRLGPRHHQFENIVRYVQKALDDIRRVIDRTEFDELCLEGGFCTWP